jgi:uncharacterized membrane protein
MKNKIMNPLAYFCHRKPERTFHIKGHYFPVCARCTGFYISIIAYMIIAILIPIHYTIELTTIGFLLLIPAGIDGTTQLLELRESNNTLRFITGILGGIGLMIIVKTIKFMFIY